MLLWLLFPSPKKPNIRYIFLFPFCPPPFTQMTKKPSRRILTFPAIPPSDNISPATLLHALISLARTIASHRRRSFASHRRNARETIREIRVLLIFLEEIRATGSALTESALLCFCELYLTLQKIRCLLEDCAREGARLLVLMQLERVTNEFRILIRTVATALDVLPLASVNASLEAREMVELVAAQAWKVKIHAAPDDERAMKDVLAMLGGFENGIAPDQDNLRRVLNHLAIRSWNECRKEIKFLEEEIEFENSKGKDRDIALLSSLMGFMSYCRAVMFDVCDDQSSNERLDSKNDRDSLSCLNPEDFRCPISLELMTDPVTICTGHTYDRTSIRKWLKAGNLTCPNTGEKLVNTEIIPNITLHNLIQKFCHSNGIPIAENSSRSRDLGQTLSAGSSAAAGSMRMLSIFLVEKLSTGITEDMKKAAYEIRSLSKSSIFNRASLVDAGAVLWLLLLLSSTDPSTQENAIAALLNLSKYCKGKSVIFESGGLHPIVDVLKNGLKLDARQSAAATLFYLSSANEYREAIGNIPDAIPALVRLLRSGTTRGKKNAVVALFGLLNFQGNHGKALAAGIIPSLINVLTSGKDDLVNDSLGVLATLAENPEGALVVVGASAIPVVVGILNSSASRVGKEYCVSVLLSLCVQGGAEVISVLREVPSLMGSLYLVLTEGTSRAIKKATSLLRLLQDFHDPGSPAMSPPAIQQEHVVHVR